MTAMFDNNLGDKTPHKLLKITVIKFPVLLWLNFHSQISAHNFFFFFAFTFHFYKSLYSV